MDKQLVFQTDDRPEELLRTLEQLERDLDRCVELSRPTLGGERYLTDRELSEHRSSHEIPYYCICGKILYRESDIERMLEEHYFALP
jgi:type II secretory pathway component PulJ